MTTEEQNLRHQAELARRAELGRANRCRYCKQLTTHRGQSMEHVMAYCPKTGENRLWRMSDSPDVYRRDQAARLALKWRVEGLREFSEGRGYQWPPLAPSPTS